MEKLKMHTPDLAEENYRKLAALFPDAVTETVDDDGKVVRAIDKDVLMQEINAQVVDDGQERYQFTWPDKRKSVVLANAPIAKTLRFEQEKSVGRDGTPGGTDSENIYIEGDNLDALKLLQETYLGKVKMIYIDPPYNTGRDIFAYEDDRSVDGDSFSKMSGQFDEDGGLLFSMKENNESEGRFHTNWLNMMYPRLKLAKDLLRDDGVILISIDDCENENLKEICNEIFGKRNFIDTLIWKKRYGGGAKEKYFVSLQEYILVYCKNIDLLNDIFVPLALESAERYYSKRDSKYATRGGYRTHPLEAGKAMDARPNLIYPIPAPDGSMIYPRKQWLWSKERAYEALKNDELEIAKGKDGNWVVSSKQYLKDDKGETRPAKMLSIIDGVYTQHGTNEMINIMGNAKIFQYPKPSELIKILIQAISENKNDIIMDFFSGSASTAHALMKVNADDNGQRKYILVQYPELTDEESDAHKAGYKSICDIGEERIRRSGKIVKKETHADIDYGFRCFKVDSSNMKNIYYRPADIGQMNLDQFTDNIKEDRTPEDLLIQVMLDLGVLLSSKIEQTEIAGKKVFSVADGYLIACFDKNVTEDVVTAIAKQKPFYAVFRDSSMANDSVAANFEQIFATYSPQTVRKVL